MRFRSAPATVGVVAAMLISGASIGAQAASDKVDVCHWSDGKGYTAISIASSAADAHLSRHAEDLLVGGSVTAECEQTTTVFARAFSTTTTGEEVLIAQLEDTNGDGLLTPGDTIRTDQYPLNFDATAFGTFGVTNHTITSIIHTTSVFVMVEDAAGGEFSFTNRGYEQYRERNTTGDVTVNDDGPVAFPPDHIRAALTGPSSPSTAVNVQRGSNVLDDGYLDVEISLGAP